MAEIKMYHGVRGIYMYKNFITGGVSVRAGACSKYSALLVYDNLISFRSMSLSQLLCILVYVSLYLRGEATNEGWPPCCPNITDKNGYPDVSDCFVQCTQNVPSVMAPASYLTGEPTNLTVGIALNNLGKVNELDGTVTFDFFLRLLWEEPRWNLTNLFDAIAVHNPGIYGMPVILYMNPIYHNCIIQHAPSHTHTRTHTLSLSLSC